MYSQVKSLDFVALISGGKDSIYSILECIAHGHRLVALLHLSPKESDPNGCAIEQDSYMYQSVASECLPAIGRALDVPLYTFPVTGTALCQSLTYTSSRGDEVEDLTNALLAIIQHHPSIDAVSSGAILSTYQRNRVEHVAGRLGLTSLAYLWRRDQAELLADMKAASIDALIVKIASFGLSLERDLGCRLVDAVDRLTQLSHPPYQLNCCGEGGEYETVVLDCPLFRHSLQPDSMRRVVLDASSPECPIAYLQLPLLLAKDKPSSVICLKQTDLLSGKWLDSTRLTINPFKDPLDRAKVDHDGDLANWLSSLAFLRASTSIDDKQPTVEEEEEEEEQRRRGRVSLLTCSIVKAPKDAVVNKVVDSLLGGLANRCVRLDQVLQLILQVSSNSESINEDELLSASIERDFYQSVVNRLSLDANARFPSLVCLRVASDSDCRYGAEVDKRQKIVVRLHAIIAPASSSPNQSITAQSVRSVSHWLPSCQLTPPISQSVSLVTTLDNEPLAVLSSLHFGLLPELNVVGGLDVEGRLALRNCSRHIQLASVDWTNLRRSLVCLATSTGRLTQAMLQFHSLACNASPCCCSKVAWVELVELPLANATLAWYTSATASPSTISLIFYTSEEETVVSREEDASRVLIRAQSLQVPAGCQPVKAVAINL